MEIKKNYRLKWLVKDAEKEDVLVFSTFRDTAHGLLTEMDGGRKDYE